MVKYLSLISAIQWKKKWPKSKRRARGGKRRRKQRGIPFDLMIEILSKLPAKSLMRFRCVSKLWSRLIRSRYFTNLYLTIASSPLRPQPLGLYMSLNYLRHYECDSMEVCNNPGKSELVSLTLSSASSNSAESSSLEPDLTFPGMGGHKMVSLRGLFLYTVCRKACIYNPATRQSLTLPAVIFAQQKPNKHVYYFFGHDPVHDQYKIVCNAIFSEDLEITSEYWVFVLEPGGFWKRTVYDDQQPHFPRRQGICIKGVIYYLAVTPTCHHNVYCFDVRSEKFSKIQAPHEVFEFGESVDFINHAGKPALFHYTHIRETGVSELWVLEDGGEWSRKSLVLKPCQRHLVDAHNFMNLIVHGTAQNNEVILGLPLSCYLLYYDLIKNDLRRVIIRATMPDQWADVFIKAMDKCESIMHLET